MILFPLGQGGITRLDENDSIDNCISTLGKDEAGHVESEGSVTEEDTVSEESSIL